MIELYVKLVRNGKLNIENVPQKYRDAVKKVIEEEVHNA